MMNESTYCNMKKPIIIVSFLLNSKLLIFLELKKVKIASEYSMEKYC